MLLSRNAADSPHTVLALALNNGSERWRKTVAGAGSPAWWHLPESRLGQLSSVVAVVCGGTLTVLKLDNGGLVGQLAMGATVGEPVWVEDSGFVVVAADGVARAVVGFDAAAPGEDATPLVRETWLVPADDSITRIAWQPQARGMIVYGQKRAYVVSNR